MKSSFPNVPCPGDPGEGPAYELDRVTPCPKANLSLTCLQDIYSRPTRDRRLKTLPEMKPLLSVSLVGALWSSGYSIKLSDHMRSVFQPLPVREPDLSMDGWPRELTPRSLHLSWPGTQVSSVSTTLSKGWFCKNQDGRKWAQTSPMENWHTALPRPTPRLRNTDLGCHTSPKEPSPYWTWLGFPKALFASHFSGIR